MATLSSSDPRFSRAVQYRHDCEYCGETRMCAVIKRRGKRALRLCAGCYSDGFWRSLP